MRSGLLSYSADTIDSLPETPAVFRLRSSGQSIIYIGYAGEEGLRDRLSELRRETIIGGISELEFETMDSAEAAAASAAEQIAIFKPLYNEGYGRYRHEQTLHPRGGHCIRRAIKNP